MNNYNDEKFLEFMQVLLAITLLMLLVNAVSGCGTKVSGGTTHEVKGKAEIVTRLEIDFPICDELADDEKTECIKQILKILEGVQPPIPITGAL